MTPALIIQQATADGVGLALSPPDNIKVIGDENAVSRWIDVIRDNKPGIVAALSDQHLNASAAAPTIAPDKRGTTGAGNPAHAKLRALVDAEAFEERAAIREFDGGFNRQDAERLALADLADDQVTIH